MPRQSGLIDYDQASGKAQVFHRMHDGDWAMETIQDVSDVLDFNKAAQNHIDPTVGDGWARHVAKIPTIFFEKWRNDYGIDIYNRDHEDAVMRLLDDPEWRWLRTDNSQLSKRRVSKAQIERRLEMRKLVASL